MPLQAHLECRSASEVSVLVFRTWHVKPGHSSSGIPRIRFLSKCHSQASRAQSCLSRMDCSPPGSSVRGILQAGMLEWAAVSSSRGPLLCPLEWRADSSPLVGKLSTSMTRHQKAPGAPDTTLLKPVPRRAEHPKLATLSISRSPIQNRCLKSAAPCT